MTSSLLRISQRRALSRFTSFPYTTLFRSQIGNARVHAVLPPIATAGPQLSIRLPSQSQPTLDTLSGDWPNAQIWLHVIAHLIDRKSTRLNSSHVATSYAVFCLKKKTYRPC